MSKKLSDKDKKVWEEFVNSKEKKEDKDLKYEKKKSLYIKKTIDLHGYTLKDANVKIEKFILLCFEKGVTKINIITGKGSRSNNLNDPYQSKDLSILKYSIPNIIKNNNELMEKILKIDEDAVQSPTKGSFDIVLKKNE